MWDKEGDGKVERMKNRKGQWRGMSGGFDALVDGTDKTFASDLIKVEVSEKNDIIVTAQKRITVDTNVVVPVKLTVTNADGTNATVYASFTVTVKAYPVQ